MTINMNWSQNEEFENLIVTLNCVWYVMLYNMYYIFYYIIYYVCYIKLYHSYYY